MERSVSDESIPFFAFPPIPETTLIKLSPLRPAEVEQHSNLDALVGAEEEVELGGVRDADVDGRSGRNVAGFSGLLFLVGAEKPAEEQKRSKMKVSTYRPN
jgi:hypothetical protein